MAEKGGSLVSAFLDLSRRAKRIGTCEGSDIEPAQVVSTERPAVGRCGTCDRVLTIKKSGVLRIHQRAVIYPDRILGKLPKKQRS